MSSIPGYFLEDYVMWNHNLIVDGDTHANRSLEIAEILGRPTNRKNITTEQFKKIIELYEPHREEIERKLMAFDEDQSWRDYAYYAFNDIPDFTIKL